MQHHINILVKQFFRKETLQEVSVDELQQFTDSFPFSAAGQFLYAKKLQDGGTGDAKQQAEKSTLYFHNPIWSSWLLKEREQYILQHGTEKLFTQKKTTPPVVGLNTGFVHHDNTATENSPVHTGEPEQPVGTIAEEQLLTETPENKTELPAIEITLGRGEFVLAGHEH
jgi:hypothetical protein